MYHPDGSQKLIAKSQQLSPPEASKGEATCKFCAFRDFCVNSLAVSSWPLAISYIPPPLHFASLHSARPPNLRGQFPAGRKLTANSQKLIPTEEVASDSDATNFRAFRTFCVRLYDSSGGSYRYR